MRKRCPFTSSYRQSEVILTTCISQTHKNEYLYFMEQLKAVNSHKYPLLGGFDQWDSAADFLFADVVHLSGPGQQEFSHFVSTEIQNIENCH